MHNFSFALCAIISTLFCGLSANAADSGPTEIEYGKATISYDIRIKKITVDDGHLAVGVVQDDGHTNLETLSSNQKITIRTLETTDAGIQKIGGLTLGDGTHLDRVDVSTTVDIGSSRTSGGQTLVGHNDLRGVTGGTFSSRGSIRVDAIDNQGGTVILGGYHAGN